MRNTSRQIVVAMLLHCTYTLTVNTRQILKFFKQAGECCYFFNGSFCELANPLCLWITFTEIVWFMAIFFCVYWSEMHLVFTLVRTANSWVQVCAIRVYEPWSRVLKKCLKLCSMKFWYAKNQFYNKNRIVYKALILIII